VRRDDTLQADMIAWLGRALDGVLAKGVELTQVARHVNAFADACARKIGMLWKDNLVGAFHRNLLSKTARPSLSEHYRFTFDPALYPARCSFGGRWTFRKHFYPLPGELDDDVRAEETACAITIDTMPEERFWVRNLEHQPASSFWLPTSSDRFYPDFVLQLDDGRIAVVEYKGADRWSSDDSKEKRDIGKVWATASGGKCRSAMVTSPDAAGGLPVAEQIRRGIA
jgi:type III restriction enzyme